MFTLFRYGLLPVVFFCVVVTISCIGIVASNEIHKSNWPQTVVTVLQAQDFGDALAEFRGTPNDNPDPRGTASYTVGGKDYVWQGRGLELGVTAMKPGDKILVYYNPKNPEEIGSLLMPGLPTGSIIFAVALAFLVFYAWFFWLRGFRRPPRDGDGEAPEPVADNAPSRPALADRRPAALSSRPAGKSFGPGRGATFGRR